MSSLWFDIMNLITDDPDWSDTELYSDDLSEEDNYFEDQKFERAYRQLENTKSGVSNQQKKYKWLKPPESMD